MGSLDFYTGRMLGRMYRCSGISRNIVVSASQHSWVPSEPGDPYALGFCRSTLPHDGDIGYEDHPLGYAASHSGVSLLWLREERRAVSGKRAKIAAAAAYSGTVPFEMLPRVVRERLVDSAKLELLRGVEPTVAIIPVVIVDDLVFIGRLTTDIAERCYVKLLSSVADDLSFDPGVWSPDDPQWHAASYACLVSAAQSDGGRIGTGVRLAEVKLKGRSLSMSSSDSDERVREAVASVVESAADVTVRQLTFLVSVDGTEIEVRVDERGVAGVSPASSVGGLPHERVRRRFADVSTAIDRLSAAISMAVDSFS